MLNDDFFPRITTDKVAPEGADGEWYLLNQSEFHGRPQQELTPEVIVATDVEIEKRYQERVAKLTAEETEKAKKAEPEKE